MFIGQSWKICGFRFESCNLQLSNGHMSIVFQSSHLEKPSKAHVCDAVQLDTGAIASINHWRAFVGSLASLAGGPDHRQTVPGLHMEPSLFIIF